MVIVGWLVVFSNQVWGVEEVDYMGRPLFVQFLVLVRC